MCECPDGEEADTDTKQCGIKSVGVGDSCANGEICSYLSVCGNDTSANKYFVCICPAGRRHITGTEKCEQS